MPSDRRPARPGWPMRCRVTSPGNGASRGTGGMPSSGTTSSSTRRTMTGAHCSGTPNSIVLMLCMSMTLIASPKIPLSKSETSEKEKSGLFDAFKSYKNLPRGMFPVLIIQCFSWLGVFPFIMYSTDSMGREVFRGDDKGTPARINDYNRGVRDGSFGLLLNSFVLGICSILIDPLCRKLTPKVVWAISSFIFFLAMVATMVISMISMKGYSGSVQLPLGPDQNIKIAALVIFASIGFPFAVGYSIPYTFVSTLAINQGSGQGTCIGFFNISNVVPQTIMSLVAGPWNSIFSRGNLPAFAMGGVFSFIGALLALMILPNLSRSNLQLQDLSAMH